MAFCFFQHGGHWLGADGATLSPTGIGVDSVSGALDGGALDSNDEFKDIPLPQLPPLPPGTVGAARCDMRPTEIAQRHVGEVLTGLLFAMKSLPFYAI